MLIGLATKDAADLPPPVATLGVHDIVAEVLRQLGPHKVIEFGCGGIERGEQFLPLVWIRIDGRHDWNMSPDTARMVANGILADRDVYRLVVENVDAFAERFDLIAAASETFAARRRFTLSQSQNPRR